MIKITSHPQWIKDFLDLVEPYVDKVVNHKLFKDFSSGSLTIKQCQGALINFYPLIETFPTYMALNLAKVPLGNSIWNKKTRDWLMANISQERLHTAWWRHFAAGFRVPSNALDNEIYPPPEMDAINNYLWRICTHGSLAEGMSAANFAVEGPTGEWTKRVKGGFEKYRNVEGIEINEKTLEWVVAHASYDDRHPDEALEIIKAYVTTEEEQEKVKQAAKRTLEYYALALDSSYEIFK
jgi:pyrroloquinoline quinone (PQQ) biosynthesis protein C